MRNIALSRNRQRATAFVAASVCMLVALAAVSAKAQQTNPQDLLLELDRKQKDLYRSYTRVFCQRFYHYGQNEFMVLPNYRNNVDNSSASTIKGVAEKLTKVELIFGSKGSNSGIPVGERRHKPPKEIVEAIARTLPDLNVGHYGYLEAVTVKEVIGPTEMIVTKPVFVDQAVASRVMKIDRSVADGGKDSDDKEDFRFDYQPIRAAMKRQKKYEDQSYRLIGFSTKQAEVGSVYTGPKGRGLQVAVASTEPETESHCVLVSVDRMRVVRTTDFAGMLAYVGMTPKSFIELVRKNRQKHGVEKGDVETLSDFYRRLYSRYQVDQSGDSSKGKSPNNWTYDRDAHFEMKMPKFPNILL